MLYPQSNRHRQVLDLSGFWEFCFDPDELGVSSGWSGGFYGGRPVAVPASWNDQFEDGRDFLGPAWYQTVFDLPWGWDGKRSLLRFGSVNYLAEVWLNEQPLGLHEGGHLPFEFDVTELVRKENNHLVVCVDGRLAFDRVPPGNVTGDPRDFFPSHTENYPQAQFDFFPYCGIQRPVILYATPVDGLQDIAVQTEIAGPPGRLRVQVQQSSDVPARVRFLLDGHGQKVQDEIPFSSQTVECFLEVPDAAFWSPSNPNLYNLTVEYLKGGYVCDSYRLKIGIRTVKVDGDQLLLNGQPIYLKGFGRHEDFPIVGRGYLPALIVKDYALMGWIGADFFAPVITPIQNRCLIWLTGWVFWSSTKPLPWGCISARTDWKNDRRFASNT